MFRKIAVGISGGVDSAVAAKILKNRGFNLQGVFMKNWDLIDESGRCSVEADWEDAQWVCQKLNIPILEVNFVKEYWNEIFGKFLHDYESGLTPNPDILCNKYIKFDAFFKYAMNHLQVDAIATGHYACSSFGQFLENYKANQNAKLLCSTDTFKDQTFFLSEIPQTTLQKTMFPLGNLKKEQIKQIAIESGLDRIALKKESTGICFVGKRNFQEFISEYVPDKPGDFVNIDTGEIVGKHDGIHYWTIGQRCRIFSADKPYFVLIKNNETNTIYVAKGTNHPSLFSNIVYTEKPYWIDKCPFIGNNHNNNQIVKCKFRFQHTKPLLNCTITQNEHNLLIHLNYPLRALTPGQYAVFYHNNECLGAARILKPGPSMKYATDNEFKKFKILLNQLKENNNIFIET